MLGKNMGERLKCWSKVSRVSDMFDTLRKNKNNAWPCPAYELDEEPHFLFIITLPYSGSTALAQVLNSCHGASFLQPRAEGQWLVPGMCDVDRWNPDKVMNWDSIRAVWLQRVQLIAELVQDVDFIIEKSPPNLVRMDQLLKVFPKHVLMAFNRNPFANCASILYRDYDPLNYSLEKRESLVRQLAKQWLFRSRWIRKWIDEWNVVNFTYEDFCQNPEHCIRKMVPLLPALEGVDVHKSIKVKDYPVQKISNQNLRQIKNLTDNEIEIISSVLRSDSGLVEYFGYDVVCR